MADEVLDAGTGTETTVESGVESSQQTVGAQPVETPETTTETLQDRMMDAGDYWYSDGIDGYYGPDGQPVMNDNGEYVKTQEELNALLGKQTQNAKTPEPKQQQQDSQQSDDLFETNGKYDPVKGNSLLSDVDMPYVSPLSQLQQQQQQPMQEQQLPNVQQQQPQQEKSISEQVMEFEAGMRANLIDPLIEAREDMIEAGRWNDGNPRAVKLNQLIQERTRAVEDLAKEKQLKLWEEQYAAKDKLKAEKDAAKELQDSVNMSIFNVGKNYNGQESFEKLMLGTQDAKGNFVTGSGHDLVMAIVDLLYDGQNVEDVGKATKDGWHKIAKNQQRLATIAKYVAGYHIAKNLTKNNAEVQKATLAEERNRRRMVSKPAQSIVPSQQGNAGMPPELADFLGVSTV